MSRSHRKVRSGLTVIELLISLSIIGLVAAMAIPAIHSARQTANRIRCASNLHEIGAALHNYVDIRGELPFSQSLHRDLLPFIEQQPVADKMPMMSAGMPPDYEPLSGIGVPLYVCPSDGATGRPAVTNYLGCWSSTTGHGGDGMFPTFPGHPVKLNEVTDGLSNTAAMSEILVSDGTKHRRRTAWMSPPPKFSLPEQLGAYIDLCDSVPPDPSFLGWHGGENIGHLWDYPGSYNHAMPPNRPMCTNAGARPEGLFPANSNHSGSVQCLMGDGRLELISETISLSVWREMASRNAKSRE